MDSESNPSSLTDDPLGEALAQHYQALDELTALETQEANTLIRKLHQTAFQALEKKAAHLNFSSAERKRGHYAFEHSLGTLEICWAADIREYSRISAGLLEDLRTYPEGGPLNQQLDLLQTKAHNRLVDQNYWVSRSLFRMHYLLLKTPATLLTHLTQPSGQMLVRYREEALRVGRAVYLKDCRLRPTRGPMVLLTQKPEESAEDF